MTHAWRLDPQRCFDPDPTQRSIANDLYQMVRELPLVCPHTHVAPGLLADVQAGFGTPADLFIIPDHYVLRLLYSQGLTLEALGVPPRDGGWYETDHRRIWQHLADNFHIFRGTPSGLWLTDELTNVFGVTEKLNADSANRIYDHIVSRLAQLDFTPRALFARFNIEVLATTDAATDDLAPHQVLRAAGYNVRPTFRPDSVTDLNTPDWATNVSRLGELASVAVSDYHSYIAAIEARRVAFKVAGATATDQAALTPYTERLSDSEAATIIQRALRGQLTTEDAARFTAHMFMEMARMSIEDGLVMQMHIGSFRNHNQPLYQRFGADIGADIPVQIEWTRNLRPLLNAYGNDARLRLILFGLDESTYSRELAPLAGHYPAVLLGPPWWFHDSVNGMNRYLECVTETAGLYNTAGFNDDTRAFASIPARHDVWRRVVCNWVAGRVVRGLFATDDAPQIVRDCVYDLARRAYRLI